MRRPLWRRSAVLTCRCGGGYRQTARYQCSCGGYTRRYGLGAGWVHRHAETVRRAGTGGDGTGRAGMTAHGRRVREQCGCRAGHACEESAGGCETGWEGRHGCRQRGRSGGEAMMTWWVRRGSAGGMGVRVRWWTTRKGGGCGCGTAVVRHE
jgi:hypothetical protein